MDVKTVPSTLESLSQENIQLSQQIVKLLQQEKVELSRSCQSKLKALCHNSLKLKQQVETLQQESDMPTDIEAMGSRLESVSQENIQLCQQIVKLKQEYVELNHSCQSKLKALRQNNLKLKQQVETLQQEKTVMQTKLENLDQKNNQLCQQTGILVKEKEAIQTRLKNNCEQNMQLNQQVETLQQEKSEFQHRVREIQKLYDTSQSKLISKENENKLLNKNVQELQQEVESKWGSQSAMKILCQENMQLYEQILRPRRGKLLVVRQISWSNTNRLVHENKVLRDLVKVLMETPAEKVVETEFVTQYKYTDVDKLISYCKLLESVLEEEFNVELTEEEQKHKGLGIAINKAQYQGIPLSRNLKNQLWKIATSRNKLSHETDVDALTEYEMGQVDEAWINLQEIFRRKGVPEHFLLDMERLEEKYRKEN